MGDKPLINRINKAPALRLVTSQTKRSENDPGNSQGSGMAYDGPIDPKSADPQPEEKQATAPASPETIVSEEKPRNGKTLIKSLNAVYEEFFKKKRNTQSVGLTTQYSDDHSTAKGMLLNKKAE